MRGVCAVPRHALQPQLSALFAQQLGTVQLCLAGWQQVAAPAQPALLRAVKWGLRSIQQFCEARLPVEDALLGAFASLANSVLFSLFQLPGVSWARRARVRCREDLVPVTEAVVAIVASLVAKAAAAPVLAQFYDAACVRQLLCCVQRSMFPLGPQLRALLLQNDEDFYAAYVGTVGARDA